ncbi:MAG: hypothetical protein JW762_05665 [Dehalococcoidales bacterium]|nr:hypothetical protein [Dehalococcoidales bacterium]
MRRKIKVVFFGILNIFIVSTMVGTVYAQTSNPEHVYCVPPGGHTDLKIRDQDETWSDGVFNTWTVENMVPGSVYELDGSFIGLKARHAEYIGISCDYSVLEALNPVESDTDPFTDHHPDAMAREIIITKAVYKTGEWSIDLLTGYISQTSLKERCLTWYPLYCNWRIRDIDGDMKITFYDFKYSPVYRLPVREHGNKEIARFLMSVKFAESAGNDLQGDTFDLTMSYSIMQ